MALRRGKPTFRNHCELTSREYMHLRRILLKCCRCPPHRSDNVTRRKRSPQKPKTKNKRR